MYKNAGFDFNREQTPPLICHDEFEIHCQETEMRADGCQVSNELDISANLQKYHEVNDKIKSMDFYFYEDKKINDNCVYRTTHLVYFTTLMDSGYEFDYNRGVNDPRFSYMPLIEKIAPTRDVPVFCRDYPD